MVPSVLDLKGPKSYEDTLAPSGDIWDLTRGRRLWITKDATGRDFRIGRSRRIGVTSAGRLKLRFVLQGNRFVSGPRSLR